MRASWAFAVVAVAVGAAWVASTDKPVAPAHAVIAPARAAATSDPRALRSPRARSVVAAAADYAPATVLPAPATTSLVARVVSSADGRPIVGARFECRFWSAPGVAPTVVFESDAEGVARLVPPQVWTGSGIVVRARGFVCGRYGPAACAFADGAWKLMLDPSGVLEGRVHDAPTNGPVAGATVWLYSGRSRTMWGLGGGPLARATTDADGRFRTDEAPTDSVRVYVEAPGHMTAWSVVACPPKEPLDVPLRPAGRVRGVVRAADGTPASGALVRVDVEGYGLPPFAAGAGATTGADGRFDLDGLPLGARFSVRANTDGWNEEGDDHRCAARGGLVAAAAGDVVDCDLTLAASSSVTVRVVGPDGVPVERASVTVEPGARRSDTTDDSGEAKVDDVARGPQVVVVEARGFVRAEAPFDVAEGEAKAIDVRLVRGGTLRGAVVDVDGTALPFEHVEIVELREGGDGAPTESPNLDGDGRFEVHLAAGRYVVKSRRRDVVESVEVEIIDGVTSDATVRLPAR